MSSSLQTPSPNGVFKQAERLPDATPSKLMLSKLNHDLRSPLSAIMGYAALLEDCNLAQADRIEYVAAVQRGAEQMLATLDSLQSTTPLAPAQPRIKVSPLLISRRVLLADDEPRLRQLTQFCLEKGGASVVAVGDGQKAVDRATAELFDVILLDMEMPVMDGFQAARALRDCGYTGPIVAFTGYATPNERDRCLAAGCSRCVTKPFEAETLVRELSLAIEAANEGE